MFINITMETKDYIIGTLTVALLVSLGFAVQPDDTHICRELMLTMQCNRLSSTEKTCYPTANTRIGSKYCSSGWELILKDAVVLKSPAFSDELPAQWSCDSAKCTQIR